MSHGLDCHVKTVGGSGVTALLIHTVLILTPTRTDRA